MYWRKEIGRTFIDKYKNNVTAHVKTATAATEQALSCFSACVTC